MFSPDLMFNPWNCYAFIQDGAVRPSALEIFTPVEYYRGPGVVALPTLDKWEGKHGYYQENSGDDDWWNAGRFALRYRGRYATAMQNYQLQVELDKMRFWEQNPHLAPSYPPVWRDGM